MLFPLNKIFFFALIVNFGTCVKPRVSGCVHPLIGRHGEEANLRMMHFLFQIALKKLSKECLNWLHILLKYGQLCTWYNWQHVSKVTQGICRPVRTAMNAS